MKAKKLHTIFHSDCNCPLCMRLVGKEISYYPTIINRSKHSIEIVPSQDVIEFISCFDEWVANADDVDPSILFGKMIAARRKLGEIRSDSDERPEDCQQE